MSFLNRFFRKKDPFKDVPAFKQIMSDVKMEEKNFLERMEKIFPVISCESTTGGNTVLAKEQNERDSEGSRPVSYPVNFDNELSINLEVGDGENCELLKRSQIVIAKDKVTPDQLVGKAFANLFKKIEDKISISMINEDIGMLSGCNNLGSSLVLVNEIWKLIKDKVGSEEIVFGIPARDILIFCAAGKRESADQLDLKVKELFNSEDHPKKISRRLYIFLKEGTTKTFRE